MVEADFQIGHLARRPLWWYFHHMMNTAAIVIDDLLVRRGGVVVIPGLRVCVPAGQVVGLLGPSGSGKSTLMRAVVGVQKIAGGTVTVLGQVAGSPALRSRVGYVTQSPSVYADLTVRANVAYFAGLVGQGSDAVDKALAEVDLSAVADRKVDRLSGGQRSRVSLAAALAGDPELLVLDEPTVGLDPVLRRDLWNLFHRLAGAGRSLLVSSHVMDEATRCDRLLLMRDGSLLSDSTPDELLARTGALDAEAAFLHLIDTAADTAKEVV